MGERIFLGARRTPRWFNDLSGDDIEVDEPGQGAMPDIFELAVVATSFICSSNRTFESINVSLLLTFRALPRQLIEESKYHHKVYRIYLLSYKQFLYKQERGSVAAVLSG